MGKAKRVNSKESKGSSLTKKSWKDTVHASSKTDNWPTPQRFFDELNAKHKCDVDTCATSENSKCQVYFSPEEDGLTQDWFPGRTYWCNPPYGHPACGKWVKKGYESARAGAKVVMLLPARTSTKWFHNYVWKKCTEICYVKGRLKFGDRKGSAFFASIVVVFSPETLVD